MKVVLSRKSMDAVYGGLPSPVFIFEDNSMWFFPLPIPYKKEYSGVHYNDIVLFDNYTAWNFIQDVAPGYKQSKYCHLDPDLKKEYLLQRTADWQPAFGQLSTSQLHLANNNIGAGDVFLFFGWFQFATMVNGKAKYVVSKDYPNGFHAVYGYLQVQSVCKPHSNTIPTAIAQHPHVQFTSGGSPFKHSSNTVYISSEIFIFNNEKLNKPGAGLFAFNESLVLTQKGQLKRTLWQLPLSLHPTNGTVLSYNAAAFWKKENGKAVLSAYSRGQEFIFKKDVNNAAAKWCADLIINNEILS